MTTTCFDIDFTQFDIKEEEVEIRGASIDVIMSPYDIPTKFRFKYSGIDKPIYVGFEYIDHDPKFKRFKLDDTLILEYGKNSGRVYGITILTKQLRKEDLNSSFEIAHTIYNLSMNMLTMFTATEKDVYPKRTNLLIQYLRDNWAKTIFSTVDVSNSTSF
jgi:hypothetical protein